MPVHGMLFKDEGDVLTPILFKNEEKEIVKSSDTSLDISTNDDLLPPPYNENGSSRCLVEPEKASYVNMAVGVWTEKQCCLMRFFSMLLICAELAWPVMLYYLNRRKLLSSLYYEEMCVAIRIYRPEYGSSGLSLIQYMDCHVIHVLILFILCCAIIDIILYTKYPDLLKYKGYVSKIPYILKKVKIILLSVPITYTALFISGERYFPILMVTCLWMVTINSIPILLYIITKMPSGIYQRNQIAQLGILLHGLLHACVIIFMTILNYFYEYVSRIHTTTCIMRFFFGIAFPLVVFGGFSVFSTASYATVSKKDSRNKRNGCSFLSIEFFLFISIVVQTHISALYFDN